MRVLMFKEEFSGLVKEWKKLQTIRKKAHCKRGDMLSLRKWKDKPYRSKHVILHEPVECSGILPVKIGVGGVVLNRQVMLIGSPNADALAVADGFPDSFSMIEWFQQEHGLPFKGEVIQWSLPPTPPIRPCR